MKITRVLTLAVLFGSALGMAATDFAVAQPFRPPVHGGRVRVVPRPPVAVRRAPVVIHPASPIRRPPRPVVVRPPRVVVRPPRVAPQVFLPPVIFSGVVVVERYGRGYYEDRGYSADNLAWQDSETLYREDEWTEFTLDCDTRGSRLWFEVLNGRLQVDWAEVVFQNGEVQVVEFPERQLRAGLYQLLDFRDGRRVDYVRMVAMATTRESTLTLWLER
jgi:hypothetical protein